MKAMQTREHTNLDKDVEMVMLKSTHMQIQMVIHADKTKLKLDREVEGGAHAHTQAHTHTRTHAQRRMRARQRPGWAETDSTTATTQKPRTLETHIETAGQSSTEEVYHRSYATSDHKLTAESATS